MLKIKIISVFLSLLMTLQMLPIAQIGCMLSSNQWTEELPHSQPETGKGDASVPYVPYLPPQSNHQLLLNAERKALAYLHLSASIPSNHSNDIVSPPPDLV